MKQRHYIYLLAIAMGIIISLGDVSALFAQESTTEEFTLEEITVTAQKREENQQKVPMNMEVISSEDIELSGKNGLADILSNLPGAVISSDSDGLRISLRGMSDDSSALYGQSTSMPTVAINMDGVYSNRRDTGSGLFDMERVEVLYGPQSTIYASNSPGGIVNIITASPKLNEYDLSGTLEYGNYNRIHAEGAMNAPIGDKMAMRAAYSLSSHDGYLSNGGNDEEVKSARVKTLLQPNDKLSFMLTGELSKSSGHFFGMVPSQFKDQDELDDPWWSDDYLPMPSYRNNKKIYGRMDLDLGFGSLSFVPSYSNSKGHSEMYDIQMGLSKQDRKTEERGGELRMTSTSDSTITWIVGLNYYKSSDILDQDTYIDGVATGEYNYNTLDDESKAAFANVTYPITDRFRTTAGYRRSWEDVDVYRDGAIKMPSGSYKINIYEYNSSYKAPDYKLGVEYDLSESAMVYANWTTSYRAQGLQNGTGGSYVATPPPEKLKAYTVGSKNRFLNNKLQVNAEAFYYDYKNYFVQEVKDGYYGTDLENPTSEFADSDPGSSTWGEGHMMGVDLKTSTQITAQDTLSLSVSYLKTEWDDLTFNYQYPYEVTSTSFREYPGEIVAITIAPMEAVSYKGKSMTHSPKYTITSSYRHVFNLWNGGVLESQIDANYKSSFRLTWDDSDYPYNYQEAYYKFDVSATYNNPDGKWSLSSYVRNVQNYAEKLGYMSRPDAGYTTIGTPRTYGAVLTVRY